MSTLNLENIKHPDSVSNNISVDSSGNTATVGNTTVGGTSVSTSNGAVGRILGVKSTQNNIVTGETSVGYGLILESRNTGRSGSERIAQINMSADGSGNGYIGLYTSPSGSDVVSRMNIDSAGRVTMPYQPAFFAYLNASATQPSAVNVVAGTFSTLHNIGGHYSTSTKKFTAPIDGVYSFTVNFATQSNSPSFSYFSAEIQVNGVRKVGGWTGVNSPSYHKATSTFTIQLSSGDYVEMAQEANASYAMQGNNNGSQPMTFFSGYLIG